MYADYDYNVHSITQDLLDCLDPRNLDNNIDFIHTLLKRLRTYEGMNINKSVSFEGHGAGTTFLHRAIETLDASNMQQIHIDMIKILLEYGANPGLDHIPVAEAEVVGGYNLPALHIMASNGSFNEHLVEFSLRQMPVLEFALLRIPENQFMKLCSDKCAAGITLLEASEHNPGGRKIIESSYQEIAKADKADKAVEAEAAEDKSAVPLALVVGSAIAGVVSVISGAPAAVALIVGASVLAGAKEDETEDAEAAEAAGNPQPEG